MFLTNVYNLISNAWLGFMSKLGFHRTISVMTNMDDADSISIDSYAE